MGMMVGIQDCLCTVADKEKDLSAGTLYAAKFKQTGTVNGGSGDLK